MAPRHRLWKRVCGLSSGLAMALAMTSSAFAAMEIDAPSARLVGMGNAGVASSNPLDATWTNPASLGELGDELYLGADMRRPFQMSWVNEIGVTAGVRAPKVGGFGLSYFSRGVTFHDTTLSKESRISLAWGTRAFEDPTSRLEIGAQVNYYALTLGTSTRGEDLGSTGTVGLTIGARAVVYDRVALGLRLENLNNPALGADASGDLVKRVVLGVGYLPQKDLEFDADLDKGVDRDLRLRTGVEAVVTDWAIARVGMVTGPVAVTGGFSFTWKGVSLDYGLSSSIELPITHTFGLSYRGAIP